MSHQQLEEFKLELLELCKKHNARLWVTCYEDVEVCFIDRIDDTKTIEDYFSLLNIGESCP